MIIGIDGNEANVSRRVGIGEYAYEMLMQLYTIVPDDVIFHVYLKEPPRKDFPLENKKWKYVVFGPKKLWTQIALPAKLFLTREKPDVFFTPTHYAPRFSPRPTVISLMDVAYAKFPELFAKADLYQLKNWTAYSVMQAARVLTISNSTKNDIIKEYQVSPKKVIVTYLGVKPVVSLTPAVYPMNVLKTTYGISSNYILFVGTLQPRKNITRLIEAFSLVVAKEKDINDLQLVVVGKKGWLYEEILAAPAKFGIAEKVKFLDFVPNEDLPALYKNALCYVLPSLYEGFGLPVLEAMKNSCPVITSNVSSLPEAGGDACLYVDPEDVEDIAKKIHHLITNDKLRKELIVKGYKQVAKFSWEKTAQQTLEILREVATRKGKNL